jgi:hypothetical protein
MIFRKLWIPLPRCSVDATALTYSQTERRRRRCPGDLLLPFLNQRPSNLIPLSDVIGTLKIKPVLFPVAIFTFQIFVKIFHHGLFGPEAVLI